MRTLETFSQHLLNVGFIPKTVIDAGVAWGTPELYKAFSSAYFVLIEALPYFERHLKTIIGRYGGEYHLCAVADAPGTAVIYTRDDPHQLAGASLYTGAGAEASTLSYVVPITTLDALLDARVLEAPILLKTDCQGADYAALRGGTNLLARTEVVIAETSLFNERNRLHDVIGFMDSQGFAIYDLCGHMNRPYDQALGQVDVAFVKTDSYLRTVKRWA